MPPDKIMGQAQLLPHSPHLILEQIAKGFHEVEPEPVGEPADIVVGLDDRRGASNTRGLDDIRIQGALRQIPRIGKSRGLGLKDINELPADDLPFLFRIIHPFQSAEKTLRGVDPIEIEAEVRNACSTSVAFVLPQQTGIDEDRNKTVADGFAQEAWRSPRNRLPLKLRRSPVLRRDVPEGRPPVHGG